MADDPATHQGLQAIAAAIENLARGVNRVAAALEAQRAATTGAALGGQPATATSEPSIVSSLSAARPYHAQAGAGPR
jgi:hypothetical protein